MLSHGRYRRSTGGTGQRRIALANGKGAVRGQLFHAFQIRLGFQTLGTGVFQRRLVFGNHRFRASALLQVVIKSCNFHCQLRLGLMDALAIDTVIYLQQQLAFLTCAKS